MSRSEHVSTSDSNIPDLARIDQCSMDQLQLKLNPRSTKKPKLVFCLNLMPVFNYNMFCAKQSKAVYEGPCNLPERVNYIFARVFPGQRKGPLHSLEVRSTGVILSVQNEYLRRNSLHAYFRLNVQYVCWYGNPTSCSLPLQLHVFTLFTPLRFCRVDGGGEARRADRRYVIKLNLHWQVNNFRGTGITWHVSDLCRLDTVK